MEKSGIFEVQEFHRGEWQPIKVKGENTNKTVSTTFDRIERMNRDQGATKLRYVEVKKGKPSKETETEDAELEAVRAKYLEVVGKKAHHMKSIESLNEEIEAKEKAE